jgi:hypothetical protein
MVKTRGLTRLWLTVRDLERLLKQIRVPVARFRSRLAAGAPLLIHGA